MIPLGVRLRHSLRRRLIDSYLFLCALYRSWEGDVQYQMVGVSLMGEFSVNNELDFLLGRCVQSLICRGVSKLHPIYFQQEKNRLIIHLIWVLHRRSFLRETSIIWMKISCWYFVHDFLLLSAFLDILTILTNSRSLDGRWKVYSNFYSHTVLLGPSV